MERLRIERDRVLRVGSEPGDVAQRQEQLRHADGEQQQRDRRRRQPSELPHDEAVHHEPGDQADDDRGGKGHPPGPSPVEHELCHQQGRQRPELGVRQVEEPVRLVDEDQAHAEQADRQAVQQPQYQRADAHLRPPTPSSTFVLPKTDGGAARRGLCPTLHRRDVRINSEEQRPRWHLEGCHLFAVGRAGHGNVGRNPRSVTRKHWQLGTNASDRQNWPTVVVRGLVKSAGPPG